MFIRFVVFCAALVMLAAILVGLLVINRDYGAVPAFVGLASVLLVGVWVVRDKPGIPACELTIIEDAPKPGRSIRKFIKRISPSAWLAREGKFLLEELGAPDARTLLRRATFWLYFYVGCGIVMGGIVAVGQLFGLPAMAIAVVGVLLFSVWLQNRTGGYGGADPEMCDWMGVTPPGNPQLPPPDKRALQAPSVRQITRSQRPALPGPKK